MSYESSHHQGAISNSQVWLLTLNCEAQWAPVYFIFISFVASHYATFLLNPRTYGVLQFCVLRHLELTGPLRWLSRNQRLGQLTMNRNMVRQMRCASISNYACAQRTDCAAIWSRFYLRVGLAPRQGLFWKTNPGLVVQGPGMIIKMEIRCERVSVSKDGLLEIQWWLNHYTFPL